MSPCFAFPSIQVTTNPKPLTKLTWGNAALIGPADLVYLYDPPPTNGLASLVLKLFRGTPIVHHIADMWPETVIASGMLRGKHLQGFATLALGKWCKFLYHHASVITVLSPGFKRLLVERGVPAKKVEVIYNWADEQSFCPVERDPAMARELGMDARFNIVYAGNMGPVQGLDNILAAARLIQDQPRIQIVLAGTGPSEPELRRQAREFGLRNVRFIGQREYAEMPRINALADALLVHLRDLPFLHATIPGKLQVSMASGRPILIAVGGDAADLVRDAGAGLVVEPENPGELARAMIAMSCMPKEQLEELGQRGRAYYLGHLSMGIAGQRMEEIFRKVVAGPYGGRKESTPKI